MAEVARNKVQELTLRGEVLIKNTLGKEGDVALHTANLTALAEVVPDMKGEKLLVSEAEKIFTAKWAAFVKENASLDLSTLDAKGLMAAAVRLEAVEKALDRMREIADGKRIAVPPNHEARRLAFIEKYQIQKLGEGQVSLNLQGTSRIDFLREAQTLVRDVYGRDAILTGRFETWAAQKVFTNLSNDAAIQIDGNVRGSAKKSRGEQVQFLEAKGLQMPALCDLAVAHVAYFIATGKDLFDGCVVRARGGALCFGSNGLYVRIGTCDVESRGVSVAASAALPSRNCSS